MYDKIGKHYLETNGFASCSTGNLSKEEKNGDSENDDKPRKMSMITETGKNNLKVNHFPICNAGNSSKGTTIDDNEDDGNSHNFQNNRQHFYEEKQEDN